MVTLKGGAGARDVLTVAHVIHSLGSGGAESVLVEFVGAAEEAGLRPVIVGLSDAYCGEVVDRRAAQQMQECGATVYEMHGGRYSPTHAATLARLLRAERADIVHTHLKHADVVGGAAARLARLPSVSTLHVIDIPTSRAHRLRVRAAVLARRQLSRSVIALSSEQYRWYSGHAGADTPITVIPNGVSEPKGSRDRDSIRAELGVPASSVLALCVSLMRPEKGHADLLEAIRQLPEALPLVVAMAGDGPLLANVRDTVASDPVLAERVRVLGYRSDVTDLMTACDFVVQPSLEDALPTSLITALATGRPIVGTKVGGIPDIVAHGCGFLVDAGRPSGLAAGIAEMTALILTDEAALQPMCRNARQRYEDQFSAQRWVQSLRRVYEEAMDVEPITCSPGSGRGR